MKARKGFFIKTYMNGTGEYIASLAIKETYMEGNSTAQLSEDLKQSPGTMHDGKKKLEVWELVCGECEV